MDWNYFWFDLQMMGILVLTLVGLLSPFILVVWWDERGWRWWSDKKLERDHKKTKSYAMHQRLAAQKRDTNA
jgi:hypothetical protein